MLQQNESRYYVQILKLNFKSKLILFKTCLESPKMFFVKLSKIFFLETKSFNQNLILIEKLQILFKKT